MEKNLEAAWAVRTRGNQCTTVAVRYALADRPFNGGGCTSRFNIVVVVIGIEAGHIPARRIRHVEIIKNVGVIAEAEAVVPLVGESVGVITVTVVGAMEGTAKESGPPKAPWEWARFSAK